MWLCLFIAAWAGSPDVSTSTVGVSAGWSAASSKGDVDLWVGQRLRWRIGRVAGARATVLLDGRVRVDRLGAGGVERSPMRAVGVRLESHTVTMELGRSWIVGGGPRLVDGLQLHLHPSPDWDVGLWVGLAPDLYTTRPMLRPGAGPMVAYHHGRVQASMVGELLLWRGELDRAGVLVTGRVASAPTWNASGRLDLQLADSDGRAGVADAALMVRWRPHRALRLDALADAYSSLRYLQSQKIDRDLRRFEARIDALGVASGIAQDVRDDRVFQLYGASVRFAPSGGLAPRLDVKGRVRWHEDPSLRFSRFGAGVGAIALDGVLDLRLDAAILQVGGVAQGDAGLAVGLWPWPELGVGVDTSARAIRSEAYDGRTGWYGDAFVDVPLGSRLDLMAGGAVSSEPDVEFSDVGYTGFIRLVARLRGVRPAFHDGSGSRSPRP